MNTITERFLSQSRGYNKDQVERYIQIISDEYGKLQRQYEEMSKKYAAFAEQGVTDMEAVEKVVMAAEINARQVIDTAQGEAARIVEEAHRELGTLQQEKTSLISEISGLVNRLHGIMLVTE